MDSELTADSGGIEKLAALTGLDPEQVRSAIWAGARVRKEDVFEEVLEFLLRELPRLFGRPGLREIYARMLNVKKLDVSTGRVQFGTLLGLVEAYLTLERGPSGHSTRGYSDYLRAHRDYHGTMFERRDPFSDYPQ